MSRFVGIQSIKSRGVGFGYYYPYDAAAYLLVIKAGDIHLAQLVYFHFRQFLAMKPPVTRVAEDGGAASVWCERGCCGGKQLENTNTEYQYQYY